LYSFSSLTIYVNNERIAPSISASISSWKLSYSIKLFNFSIKLCG
jgi:hypothetical protein